MTNMIGVRFREASKIYHFAPPAEEIHEGEYVVVETARGLEMARVVTLPGEDPGPVPDDARAIVRLANGDDRAHAEEMQARAEEMLTRSRQLIAERALPMYAAAYQVNLVGSDATCHFQADGHVNFMPVVEAVEAEFDVRVHMQHAGPRDRAKIVDGHDICGLRLCCSSWMTTFPKVGIRMAKEQSLALNPDKISGVCGRLLCCLTFEFEAYREMRGTLPKVGKRVSTPSGMGKVVQLNVMKQTITLELDDYAGRVEVPAVEIGMAVRVEEEPNAALDEYFVRTVEPEGPVRERSRRGGRSPRGASVVDGPGVESTDRAETDAVPAEEQPGRRRRRRGRRGSAGADERGAAPAPEVESRSETNRPEASPAGESEGDGTAPPRRRRRRRRRRGEGDSGEPRTGDARSGDADSREGGGDSPPESGSGV